MHLHFRHAAQSWGCLATADLHHMLQLLCPHIVFRNHIQTRLLGVECSANACPKAHNCARSLTCRNTTKPAAQKLAAAGAELVTADLNDEAALQQALQGAWAVFAVTNFW
jgi:NmrA-like family